MTTTSTLRDAAQAVLSLPRGTSGRIILEAHDEAMLRAALSAPADALAEPVAPAAWWIEKTEQFTLPSKDGTRPFDRNWQPLYTATQIQQAVARALADQREQIAQGWDGCMYDAVGETIDIGADIRRGGQQ